MSEPTGKYLLLWKGKQSGPFNLEEIQSKLESGDISRMHQIHANGAWRLLDEFLSKLAARNLNARRAEEKKREKPGGKTQRLTALGTNPGRGRNSRDVEFVEDGERESSAASPSARPRRRTSQAPRRGEARGDGRDFDDDFDSDPNARVSGLAIAAFAVAIFSFVITVAAGIALSSHVGASAVAVCNFVPFLDIVAWMVALTLGHMSLHQTTHDDSLGGRSFAIAALMITYFLIMVGLTVVFLMVVNRQKFPSL